MFFKFDNENQVELSVEDVVQWRGGCRIGQMVLVTLVLHGANMGRSFELRSLRPAWPTWWNSVSTKNKKNQLGVVVYTCNSSYLGGWGMRIAWTWEAEIVASWDRDHRSHHCTPAWVTEWDPVSEKKERKKDGTASLINSVSYFLSPKLDLKTPCQKMDIWVFSQGWNYK